MNKSILSIGFVLVPLTITGAFLCSISHDMKSYEDITKSRKLRKYQLQKSYFENEEYRMSSNRLPIYSTADNLK